MSKFYLHIFMQPRVSAATTPVEEDRRPKRVEQAFRPAVTLPEKAALAAGVVLEQKLDSYQERTNHSNRGTALRTLPALVSLTLLSLCAGCDKASSAPKNDPPATAETHDQNIVTVDHPEQFSVVEVANHEIADELHMNGVVAPDVNRTVPVLSLG